VARDSDRIPEQVACLRTDAMPATLISTRGFNCEVWESAGVIVRAGQRRAVNFVVKRHRERCDLRKVRVYQRDYRRLREALGSIVPAALFVATRIDGEPSVVVLAEACAPWFDLARPGNEDEARPLLARMRRARGQLARFTRAARAWAAQGRIIDLYGRENLVLDRRLSVRYLDSFGVFFYEDMLHAVPDEDGMLAARIDLSRRRLAYLESLVAQT